MKKVVYIIDKESFDECLKKKKIYSLAENFCTGAALIGTAFMAAAPIVMSKTLAAVGTTTLVSSLFGLLTASDKKDKIDKSLSKITKSTKIEENQEEKEQ